MFRQALNRNLVGYKHFKFQTTTASRRSNITPTMADSSNKGIPLTEVVNALHKFADPLLAASWDNVGLLVEPTETKIVSHILLTNDLTENVMEEALNLKTDMIITYHPVIFAPIQSLTTRSWKTRIVAKCFENRIAVYSPHTTFDSVKGGVADWLASTFHNVIDKSEPIERDANRKDYGMGRFCTFKRPIAIEEAVEFVKERTNLKHVRLARARETDGFVKTVAICPGSGASVLKNVSADLYLTGEMLHHDILDAVHRGTSVILTNHSDSERGFMKIFAPILQDILKKTVKVSVSEKDADPLTTV